jgi:hypothetical protein
MITASIVKRYEVTIPLIEKMSKEHNLKYFVKGEAGLFSPIRPRGNGWVQAGVQAKTGNEPEAA